MTYKGIYFDMSAEDYFAVEAYSNSFGVAMHQQTPLDAYENWLYPPEGSPAADEGTGHHYAILEPDRYAEKVCGPFKRDGKKVERRSKADKESWAEYEVENHDKLILPDDAMHRIGVAALAAKHHPIVHALLSHEACMTEVAIFWECERTGVPCKARLDAITMFEQYAVILDLKTAEGFTAATPTNPRSSGGLGLDHLKRTAGARGYDMGAWHYMDAANSVAEADRRFFHVWVSKPPKKRPQMSPKIRVTEADAQMLYDGEMKTRQMRKVYGECQASGVWPAWPNEVELLGLMPWDQATEEEMENDE